MQASVEIRKKLATLLGHLINRCIREARMIPYVLNRDEVINLLVDDPAMFEKLVGDEQMAKSELSRQDLTVKLDAVAELGRLDRIEVFEKPFWDGPEVDLAPIMDLTNQLTRTFAVFLGNASTLFDRAFEEFMDKFRRSLRPTGMTLRTVDLTLDDVAALENSAVSCLSDGEFLQAFTFERLLSSQIMMKQVVNLPAADFSLREKLITHGLNDPRQYSALVKFVLRISYISHGAWEDLFPVLTRIIRQAPGLCGPEQLIDFIEQDVVFCCNLFCGSYAEIRQWLPDQRRLAIESSLESYKGQIGSPMPASQDP